MKKILSSIIYVALATALLLPLTGIAQNTGDMLPLDKSIITGKLSNGFTYLIKKNTTPEKRVVMYLVNKVGSILETDGQQGLAHFMEHMSFNGTKHFPKNELVEYLEKSGIRFGADLNAYTGFDETVYQLPLPSDNPVLLKNGLQILRDWAQDATLEQIEIDKERGVVLEEKRLGLGLQERMDKVIFPQITNQSRYAKRSPIGMDEVLNNFTRDTLLAFYKDWYRPDLQALIVVGDIDVKKMEAAIKVLFGDLKMPAAPKQRQEYPVSLTGRNQFIVFTDKEIPNSSVELVIKRKAVELKTKSQYRQLIIRTIFNQLVAERIAAVSEKNPVPFLGASASINSMVGDLDALSINIGIKNNDFEAGIKSVWAVLENIKRFGFTKEEIDRTTNAILGFMESMAKEKDKRNSEELIGELVKYFLKGEAVPGIEAELVLMKDIFKTLQPEDLKMFAAENILDTNRDIVITAPEKDKDILPTEVEIISWLAEVEKGNSTVQSEEAAGKLLVTTGIKAGKVVSKTMNKLAGTTEWILSNGARIILKPTTFKNDEILINALSHGGTSLIADNDYESASVASMIVASSGVDKFSSIDLRKMLAGKQVNVSPFIGEFSEGISGRSTVAEVETALQLTYLYFTSPRIDSNMFFNFKEQSINGISNRYLEPGNVFRDTMSAILGNYSIRRTAPSLEKLNQISSDKILRIYKERFANAGDFTFVFTGSFHPDTLQPLIEKYIGSLPASAVKENAKDLGLQIPPGKIIKIVKKGTENKATVRLIFSGKYEYTENNNLQIEALGDVLQFKLLVRLRETESGVYSPEVSVDYSKIPTNTYAVVISFGCSPANVDKLIKATLEEIQLLKNNGATKDELLKFSSEKGNVVQRQLQSNDFWAGYLSQQYSNDEDPAAIIDYKKKIKNVNDRSIKKSAEQYLKEVNLKQFILMPEK